MVIFVGEYCKEFRFLSIAWCACMGGCVGGCAKPPPSITVERPSRRHSSRRGASGLFLLKKDWWSSSPEDMDNNVHNSHPIRNPSIGSTSQTEETQTPNSNADNSTFVNHALTMWNERRREWVGNRPQNRPQVPREPVISWNTTYDDLLTTNQPFPQPIPLSEMIDFLVDVWHEEGLYD
uniref:TSA: Wollemia nobilis Ref_Wollemi_Transcript_3728_1007 transcribed RNA sequence n=1 Tax=Wollemia nobilis TaxID=56998 RepID=A0A0C9S8S5_9CONI